MSSGAIYRSHKPSRPPALNVNVVVVGKFGMNGLRTVSALGRR